jgi:hypothetical protein
LILKPAFDSAIIEELLSRFLPRRDVRKSEFIRQLEYRHRKRLCVIQSHAERNEQSSEQQNDED